MSTKNLVIVESPAKAKTIERYLGSDFVVASSFGHIRDLPKKGIGIDKEKNFEPTYEVSSDKKKVVAELKKLAKDKTVWLASDEDREGEAIAWHLCQALKLDPKKTKRIVFHEITKPAILQAIDNPRTVDESLVDAQQARRVLDRLVGYELSPVLWKKVQTGLSAGRVQSVAVRLIVEREREIAAFEAKSNYKVSAEFDADGHAFKAELTKKLADETAVTQFLDSCKQASYQVASIDQKPGSRNPSAPFTTSTLQQEASRKLGYGVRQTMTLAQRLYESGLITYMRTDSTVLSQIAIGAARDYITKNYGDKYSKTRQFATKNSSAQEAHEAIRPTDFAKLSAGADAQQKKLYELIWKRAVASQMAPAEIDKTEVSIEITSAQKAALKEVFIAKGEVLRFDGFLKVYGGGKDDVILPELRQGQSLSNNFIEATQTFSRPPARYGEASLVKQLEEMGIGRPSTYAPTISTIQDRGYIEKRDLEGNQRQITIMRLEKGAISSEISTETYGADRGKLLPTHTADMVTDFLTKYFSSIVDYDFTAKVEIEFDTIAEGKLKWQDMIKAFYGSFSPLIEKSADISRSETSQARVLGHHPKNNKVIIARYGRYGPMLQMGEVEEGQDKPEFAPLPDGENINSVTLEQALEMFKLPRTVGKTTDGREIKANIGRFGPYIQVGKTFVSIKPLDPHNITEKEAQELYAAKLEKDANKYIAEFNSGIKVVNGPYGPYITNGKKNAKIPKDIDPKSLDEATCKKMIAEAPAKSRRRPPTRRKKAK